MRKINISILMLCLLSLSCLAAIPKTLNYQGKLINVTTKVPITSAMQVTFLIYDDATSGSPLWFEEQLVTPDANGVISAVLGNSTPITTDFSKQLWLAVQAPTGVPNALWPRRQLTGVPYALYAVTAEVSIKAITAETALVAITAESVLTLGNSIVTAESSINADTSSTIFVDVPDMSVTFTLSKRSIVMISAYINNIFAGPDTEKTYIDTILNIDGSLKNGLREYDDGAYHTSRQHAYSTELAAGSHTIKLQWKTTNSLTAIGNYNSSSQGGPLRGIQVVVLNK